MDLNSIKATLDKATKAPWKSYIEGRDHTSGSSFIMTGTDAERDYDIEFVVVRDDDQDFIAMARNTIPELINEIERFQKKLEDKLIAID